MTFFYFNHLQLVLSEIIQDLQRYRDKSCAFRLCLSKISIINIICTPLNQEILIEKTRKLYQQESRIRNKSLKLLYIIKVQILRFFILSLKSLLAQILRFKILQTEFNKKHMLSLA